MKAGTICFFLLVFIILPFQANTGFTISPYLQLGHQVSESPSIQSQITVCWGTSVSTTGRVYYGLDPDSLDTWVDTLGSSTIQEVNITGLAPNNIYYYKVETGTGDMGPLSYFRTSPDDPYTPFNFAIIGDTRSQHPEHQMVIDMMRSWAPDFYIHSGDMVHHGGVAAEWEKYLEIEVPMMRFSPIAPAIGNHEVDDVPNINSSLYLKYFAVPLNLHNTEHYYSWDYGNVHFLHTCTEYRGPNMDLSMDLQYAQLHQDILDAAASYPWPRFIVVVMHRPAYSNGSIHSGDENYNYSTIWGPLFETARVAMAISGHTHSYERFEPIDNRTGLGDPPGEPDVIREGVIYVTSAGGGAPLQNVEDPPGSGGGGLPPLSTLAADTVYHAGLVEVRGGRMDVTFYRAEDGSTLDQFTIIRNQAPVADAGEDFVGAVAETCQLDASGSSDYEGDPLEYSWTQESGPDVSLEGADTITPIFTPQEAGTYTFSLTVNDGIDQSDPDTVAVNIYWWLPEGDGDNDSIYCMCGEIGVTKEGSGLVNIFCLSIPFVFWLGVRFRRLMKGIS
jgi:hypothetical protein